MGANGKCPVRMSCSYGFTKMVLLCMSFIFMISMSYIYGALLALPASTLVYYCMQGVFASFAQAYFCLTMTFALMFLGITVLSRLGQLTLEGNYLRNTFYYDFLEQ